MTVPRRTVAVVLAAGRSARFGSDKLMHRLNGVPLGRHIAVALADIPLMVRIAICPPSGGRRELFDGYEIIDNPHPERGMGTSLALGASRAIALDADALLVCLADMPYVTREHLRALLAVDAPVAATESEGTRMPPAVFARALLPELAVLSGERGARHLLESAASVVADPLVVRDIDVPADVA